MKKLIAILVAVIAVLAMTIPALADVTTSVEVLSTGVPPVVKAFWVAEGTGHTPTAEGADPSHLTPYSQIKPNQGFQATRTITIYAVVADAGGIGNVENVYADVYYPANDPEHPNALKFELTLNRCGTDDFAANIFDLAYSAGLPFINSAAQDPITGVYIDYADIVEELNQQRAVKYWGTTTFDNCQYAGRYVVVINAFNMQSALGSFTGYMDWSPLTACDFDFGSVNYGKVPMGEYTFYKQIPGDRDWDCPEHNAAPVPNGATIANVGNTYLKMTVKQDDMGLGTRIVSGATVWNVHYGFRLGDGDVNCAGLTEGVRLYDPAVPKGGNLAAAASAISCQILKLCALEKIDFFIKVDKDLTPETPNSGAMIVGCVDASPGPANVGVVYLPPAAPTPFPGSCP